MKHPIMTYLLNRYVNWRFKSGDRVLVIAPGGPLGYGNFVGHLDGYVLLNMDNKLCSFPVTWIKRAGVSHG